MRCAARSKCATTSMPASSSARRSSPPGLQSALVRDIEYGDGVQRAGDVRALSRAGALPLLAPPRRPAASRRELPGARRRVRDAGDSARARRALDLGDLGAGRRGDRVGRACASIGARCAPSVCCCSSAPASRSCSGLSLWTTGGRRRPCPIAQQRIRRCDAGRARRPLHAPGSRSAARERCRRAERRSVPVVAVRLGHAVVALRGLARNRALRPVDVRDSRRWSAFLTATAVVFVAASNARLRGRIARVPRDAVAAGAARCRARACASFEHRRGRGRVDVICLRMAASSPGRSPSRSLSGCCGGSDRRRAGGRRRLPWCRSICWHAGLFWLVLLLIAHELSWAGRQIGTAMASGRVVPWGLVPALAHRRR